MFKHFGVGIIPWSPLARSLLTRPFQVTNGLRRVTPISASALSPPEPYSPPEPVVTSSFIGSCLEGSGTAELLKGPSSQPGCVDEV
jgi:hypothetical protein